MRAQSIPNSMPHDAVLQLIDQAAEAIRRARFDQASAMLEQALRLDPSEDEALVLLGIARSSLGEKQSATSAFQEAIRLAPHNSKAFYNFAVHLNAMGERTTALEMAREAVRTDTTNRPARDLAEVIEKETGAEHLDLPPTPLASEGPVGPAEPPPQEATFMEAPISTATPYFRAPTEVEYAQPVHSIAFVETMAGWWDGMAWGLTVLAASAFAFELIFLITHKAVLTSLLTGNIMAVNGALAASGPLALLDIVGDLVRLVLTVWLCVDIADRRGNWLWLVPSIVSCCFDLSWVIQCLYFWSGRPYRVR